MSISNIWKKSALIDIEASGLMKGSFPVEAGWYADGVFGHQIINPSDYWDTNKWDVDAESMHGLSLQFLISKGTHPVKVAAQLNKVLRTKVVFSDSPEMDADWLDDLFQKARMKRAFELESVGRLLSYIGVSAPRAYEIFGDIQNSMPSTGRALVGVRYLKTVVEAAEKEVG